MATISGFTSFKEIPEEIVSDEMALRLVAGNRGNVKFWRLKAGLHPEPHQHPEEQITWVIKGKIDFRIGNTKRMCGPGDVMIIPGGVEHEGNFLEDCEIVSVFLPPAEGKPA